MSFGKNLKNELLYNDISYKEFSALTKIPYSTLLNYINLDILPNVETGVLIAKKLNVSVEFLVTGIESSVEQTVSSKMITMKNGSILIMKETKILNESVDIVNQNRRLRNMSTI